MIQPGTLLQDRYRIVTRIGGGGMGTVYQAEDMRLAGHMCAIKAFSPVNLPQEDHTWALTYFRQEAQMLATLDHQGLARVSNFFNEQENWFLVMDWVDGQTLSEYLRSAGGSLPQQECIIIIEQLCDVLEYLHNQNPSVIFRDLKPSNIMITHQGQVKLIDFGTARFFKPEQSRDTVNLGTPGYAAPEQYGGAGQSDARADIYSLGVVLHEMLTGHNPTITPFRLPALTTLDPIANPHLEKIIQQATRMEANDRFQTVAEFRRMLMQSGMGTATLDQINPGGYPSAPADPSLSPAQTPVSEEFPPSTYKAPTVKKRRIPAWLFIPALGAGLVICAVASVIVWRLLNPVKIQPTVEWIPTNTPSIEATPTDKPADTPTATPTIPVTASPAPTLDIAGLEQEILKSITYRVNNGDVIFAYPVKQPPTIDGNLQEWSGTIYPVPYNVYDPDSNWTGNTDLSAEFQISWDENYLYLGARITDDIHAQNATGDQIFRGDDIDLQIDADLAGDFNRDTLSGDDGQVGISPGNFQGSPPESYVWLPPAREAANPGINIAAIQLAGGYTIEAAVPWQVLGGRPFPKTPVGFNFNVNDNDDTNNNVQQVMISTSPNREWSNPITWGTLILVD
ncbi:MAG: protein kinase [Anaerolineae bacterium]|nr:protein kinase [Anaerolineae bacterium]